MSGVGKFIIVLFLVIMICTGCYFALMYHNNSLKKSYNEGLNNGLLYTQRTGNITMQINDQNVEVTVFDVCKTIIKNQLNKKGGN